MTAFQNVLPPNVIESSSEPVQGFLEIEVSRINFVITEEKEKAKGTPTFVNYNNNNSVSKLFSKATVTSTKTTATALKLIWSGENRDAAGSVSLLRFSLKGNKNNSKNKSKKKSPQLPPPLQCHNKIRYQIRSLSLFLDYLRSCEPLKISVVSSCCTDPLAETLVRLPPTLLRKYATNYKRHCNFEHKTKIYALYNKSAHRRRSGEIQLLFKMLFVAPSTKHVGEVMVTAAAAAQAEKSARKTSKSAEEIVEAMKKLDAKLVAYLAGDHEELKFENEVVQPDLSPKKLRSLGQPQALCHLGNASDKIAVEEQFRAQQLQLFRDISAVRLQMEALTLQPDGTKRMELLLSEIRPIFTVECQLSHELISGVARSDMFNIIQFESEKFQSLTQCTRFGQEAQRDVRISEVSDFKQKNIEMSFGRIHFTVWWREPGTCLNELLGMGVLELAELYNASLLEQCKCINIQRRGVHLASLYFKISLLNQTLNGSATGDNADLELLQQLFDNTTLKQCNGGGDEKHNQQTPQIQNATAAVHCGSSNVGVDNASKAISGQSNNNNHNNNNHQLDSSNFSAETCKVRLLKGFVYASETRNFSMFEKGVEEDEYFLVCRRFWQDEAAAAVAAGSDKRFNYQEQFALLNDDKFLSRVDKQHLQLEIWQSCGALTDKDGNPSNKGRMVPLGVVRLPLHQFFIAYRDAVITNHLCKGKLPVISVDAWTPIVSFQHHSAPPLGELKCLLAIGSEEQILNLKTARGFTSSISGNGSAVGTFIAADAEILFPVEQVKTNFVEFIDNRSQHQQQQPQTPPARQTSDLLDMLQRALMAPAVQRATPFDETSHPKTAAAVVPFKPNQSSNVKSFKFALDIQRAIGLPLNPDAKGKKAAAKRNNVPATSSKRFPPNEAPSTYVTFQADVGQGKLHKSHEGAVYATNVFEKSTQPQWQQRFRVSTSVNYLTNPQKHFILKVWKKAAVVEGNQCQPTPMDDSIIGFAALDLSALLRGLHIGGAFTIVDFNGRPNGQLEVRCQPLEDLQKLLQTSSPRIPSLATARANTTTTRSDATTTHAPAHTRSSLSSGTVASMGMDAVIDQFESSLDLSHLNLGQAIKRKFSELEEISQRLRSRLFDVTGGGDETQLNAVLFDSWQPLDVTIDEEVEEFERDINTPLALQNSCNIAAEAAAKEKGNEEKGKKKQENEETSKLISSDAPILCSVDAAPADCPKE